MAHLSPLSPPTAIMVHVILAGKKRPWDAQDFKGQ